MKKQATVMAVGALLTLVMSATSFAASNGVAARHGRASAGNPYAGYYDSAVGAYGYDDYSAGANSGSMGARGR
jgi:hypothetical protein